MPCRKWGWFAAFIATFASTALPAENAEIGQVAPQWELSDWSNSAPLTLKELRGKVVLVRWWTAPGCKFCRASAPALREFHARYRDKGLQIIGVYHHKSDEPLDPADVRKQARKFGFEFPVAIDRDWRTLRKWWLDDADRDFTSVTFLIDKQGVVRHVHPGGQYVKGDKDYALLKSKIEQLLKTNAGR